MQAQTIDPFDPDAFGRWYNACNFSDDDMCRGVMAAYMENQIVRTPDGECDPFNPMSLGAIAHQMRILKHNDNSPQETR